MKFADIKKSWGFGSKKDSGCLRYLASHFWRMSEDIRSIGGNPADREILDVRAILATRYAIRLAQLGL